MSFHFSRRRSAVTGLGLAMLLAACSDGTAVGPSAPNLNVTLPTPYRETYVCTYFEGFVSATPTLWQYQLTPAAAGIGTFPNGTLVSFGLPAGDYSGGGASCEQAWIANNAGDQVMINFAPAAAPANATLDSVVVTQFNDHFYLSTPYGPVASVNALAADTLTTRVKFHYSFNPPEYCVLTDAPAGLLASDPSCTPCPYVSGLWSGSSRCVPPPPPSEGCTPGYWKQSQHFGNWTAPYTPSTSFQSVFSVSGFGTLLNALGLQGGGAQALARHGTAALLNAASSQVDYSMTTSQVITLVRTALQSGNATTIENAKNQLAALNESGCSLARAELQ